MLLGAPPPALRAAPPPQEPPSPRRRPAARLDVAPCPFAAQRNLQERLGVGGVLAQVLVRRGLADPEAAQSWLAGEERHPPAAFRGMDEALALIAGHVRAETRITVHGDYDVDGICATAILVGVLRRAGARVDWYLPSRTEDGYGLAGATVERLAARGTRLLVTADCAITACAEVAAARAAGMDVVVTDHHAARADGTLPEAAIVHPSVCGYPCPDLCAAGVAHKVAEGLARELGLPEPPPGETDLDLVALATIADLVPLRGENRRLAREGLRALRATARPGLRALMEVSRVDPGRLDERSVGFRLAPRLNAAGRLYRADAGLELVLTRDEGRAAEIARELDAVNAERRRVETRILFEAEAQVREAGDRRAYVLAGEDWHPGVVGIVASRIVERHHRPAVLIALDGEEGSGSGRSIPGFDLLGGLDACAEHLVRHGGHRAAAGLTISRSRLESFRSDFERHAEDALDPGDLVPVERVDAVVPGDALGASTAEELGRLAPFGMGNPGVNLLVPAAGFSDPIPMGEGRHARFTVESGGRRARAVAFGCGGTLPVPGDVPVDATFRLELNEWNGAVEPRLVLREARRCAPDPIDVLGEPAGFMAGVLAELDTPLEPVARLDVAAIGAAAGPPVDHRGRGLAGVLAGVVATGEPVLAVCADVPLRRGGLAQRLGGFALCSWAGLEREAGLAAGFAHVVAIDPPAHPELDRRLRTGALGAWSHLAWGAGEVGFAQWIHERELGSLRPGLTDLYRALRAGGRFGGAALEQVLRGDDPQPRSPARAGRLLRVLAELGLVEIEREGPVVRVPAATRTALERSPAFRAYHSLHEDGLRFLNGMTARAA